MKRAFKVRIYPTPSQTIFINKTIGSCRFIYNKMLEERISFYNENKGNKEVLYSHKYKTEKEYKKEFEWLKEVDSRAIHQTKRNLETAYKRFFKNQNDFPKFHCKKAIGSYYTIRPTLIKINFKYYKIQLPKLGWINFKDGRSKIDGKIINATVSRTATGKYYCSLCIETGAPEKPLKPITKAIGLDMSLSKFYVDSSGNSPDGFERWYRKNEKRIAHYQKVVSRRKLGSKNRAKAQHKVNVLNEKVSNCRNDFQQKLSKQLVRDNDLIVLEDLNMRGMAGALKLGKSVNDLGWGKFVWQLQYKAKDQGTTIVFADKFFPSSKVCNSCGCKNTELKLSDREWTCPNCGKYLDRDHNAALNLYYYGLNKIGAVSPEFTPVETSMHKVGSVKQECIQLKYCVKSPERQYME